MMERLRGGEYIRAELKDPKELGGGEMDMGGGEKVSLCDQSQVSLAFA